MRNVLERASARDTAMRVALGSIARRLLQECGIAIGSRVVSVGAIVDDSQADVTAAALNSRVDGAELRCLSAEADRKMREAVDAAKEAGDTLGGVFEVRVSGLPIGLGSFAQWDRRIDAAIGRAFLGLNAVKGVEIGLGFAAAATPGSLAHDELFPGERAGRLRYATNRAGGVDAGVTNGQELVVRAAMKPLSTLMSPLRSVKLATNESQSAHIERSDVCAVPAAAVIGESLVALALAEFLLEKFGGDSMAELLPRVRAWHGSQV
jgi:chorismate synthase